eukprot:188528-Pelagomonas_calceolata.AAC.2
MKWLLNQNSLTEKQALHQQMFGDPKLGAKARKLDRREGEGKSARSTPGTSGDKDTPPGG